MCIPRYATSVKKVNSHLLVRRRVLTSFYTLWKLKYIADAIPQFPFQFQSSISHLGTYISIYYSLPIFFPVVCSKAAVATDTKMSSMFGAAGRNDTVVLWDGVPHGACSLCSFPGEETYACEDGCISLVE